MKWIIIEGADNIGKSSFIQYDLMPLLSYDKSFNETYTRHFSAPKTDNPYYEKKCEALDYVTTLCSFHNNSLVINDRSIFGELVYSNFRGYSVDYMQDIIATLKHINIEPLFILLYANKYTYEKFNIKSKHEEKSFELNDMSRSISNMFINEIHKLNYGKVVVINSNNYRTLDERNNYIIKHINAYLTNSIYLFNRTDNYANIPFNATARFYDKNHGFIDEYYMCKSYVDGYCSLGNEHRNSLYGKCVNHQTNGFGALTDVKYIFVGEAPGQKGCGKLGIPFYGDASGNLFMTALYENNISLFNTYITNAIKCCPINNDLNTYYKTTAALSLECVQRLYNELKEVLVNNDLNIIYAIGDTAYKILFSLFKQYNVKIIKLYHPAYFIRCGSKPEKYIQYLKENLIFKGEFKGEFI